MSIKTFLCIVVTTASFAITGQACAHAHPKNETPASGATVAAPPEVSIVFDDALEAALSTLTVSDTQGHLVTAAKSVLDSTKHDTMKLALPTLAAGVYQVKWVAVAVDGHRTNGSYRFTVK